MRSSRSPLQRTLLLSTVLALALFSAGAMAADTTTTSATDTTTSETTSTSDTTTSTSSSDTTTTTSETSTTSTKETTTSSSSSDDTATSTSSMPGLTTSTSATMPTLSSSSSASGSNAADTSIPTYPAATVPPTSDAPYMQRSTAPDGTVFIAVGAILGAFGLAILLWRAIIACLLHRSVEKAAMAQHLANDKAPFPTPPAPFYKYADHESGSAQNVGSGKGVRRTTRGPIPSATPSQTNLFFSPTAAGAANRDSTYRDAPNRDSSYRESRFLPAGFYAAGQSSPHNIDAANGSAISLSNLRPDSRGHGQRLSVQPLPESPGFGPQRSPPGHNMSTTSLNMPAGGRAPSAYLDDLLAEHPEMFPPSGTPASPTNPSRSNHPYRQSGRS